MARTRSRCREGREAMRSSRPRRRIIVRIASTCPWGSERRVRNASEAGTKVSPLRERLIRSMT